MHLKNLLLLASAAMGAIAQYDNGLYNDVQYDDVPYDIFADDSGPRPKVGSLGLAKNGIRGLTSRRQSSLRSDIVRDDNWSQSGTIAAEILHHTCQEIPIRFDFSQAIVNFMSIRTAREN
ncbi:hypothetical protein X797_007505 [Metarhizium robertsii]|uniref:Uncharacterized protein n=1 Tax=Metarhizium robertsii TaxID=568076 RepID=A0A014N1I7_9HYPO|nr:hypothetical protein X797_007505 [Metarhizium robertsii]